MKNIKSEKMQSDFSARFRALMGLKNLTLKHLSKKTGKAISTIGTWKNGREPKNLELRKKLADILGVEQDYLYGTENTSGVAIFSNEKDEILRIVKGGKDTTSYLCEYCEDCPLRESSMHNRDKDSESNLKVATTSDFFDLLKYAQTKRGGLKKLRQFLNALRQDFNP